MSRYRAVRELVSLTVDYFASLAFPALAVGIACYLVSVALDLTLSR